ncbi:ABC-F family ATP-binding cassette domain-containing protein [candidate division WOR-3 bacterium]|nr:ABC-F family ATP-binding cassette domain-containing protein [candidate division WOR-3 bacterium]
MIKINNICLGYAKKVLFNNINWLITEKSRTGLVGDNGTGKTTLLRAILGDVILDSGTITISGKYRSIGYLPQDLVELESINIIDYLEKKSGILKIKQSIENYMEKLSTCVSSTEKYDNILKRYETTVELFNMKDGYSFEANTKKILSGLGFKDEDFFKNCSEFSGGWKMRIFLAGLLLSKPDILLLDEPTNHLDTESMEWVEHYLKDYYGTIIAISHDRVFLDKIVTQIIELANGKITTYKGNYSFYLKEKSRRIEAFKKQMKLQDSEIKRIQTFIDRFRYKASKAKQVQSRIKMLEKLDLIELDKGMKRVNIKFPECKRSGYEVLTVKNISKTYGDLVVFDEINFSVHRGDRIAFVGVNGAGKSTLARLLSKIEKPTSGEVKYGINVKSASFSQESSNNLDYYKTVWEELNSITTKSTELEIRGLLGAFLFSGEDIHKKIGILSGGEKSRLALLKILLQDSNFLILDEPTNHLDIKTKEIFQNALLNYTGTVVIVSHDRYFLDNLVNRIIEIKDKTFCEYHGNYSYFIEKRAKKEAMKNVNAVCEVTTDKTNKKAPGFKTKEQKRQEAEKRNQLYRLKKDLSKKLELTEEKINELENIREKYETLLCSCNIMNNPTNLKTLGKDIKLTTSKLEKLYSEWDRLLIVLAEIDNEKKRNLIST